MLMLLRQLHATMVTALTQHSQLKPAIEDLSNKIDLAHKSKNLLR